MEVETAVVQVDIPPAKPKATLGDILMAMSSLDDALTIDIDPAHLVGELKDKVDAIQDVLSRLRAEAARLKAKAEPFLKDASALLRNADRLEEYVLFHMQAQGFEELPGNDYRATLRNNPPAMKMTRDSCTAEDVKAYPGFAFETLSYSWDPAALKRALMDRRKAVVAMSPAEADVRVFEHADFPMAKLTIGQKVEFKPAVTKKLKGK